MAWTVTSTRSNLLLFVFPSPFIRIIHQHITYLSITAYLASIIPLQCTLNERGESIPRSTMEMGTLTVDDDGSTASRSTI
jgi:hypothetical protein